jgi:Uroporphyrinogen decarboxylase (URO-D)
MKTKADCVRSVLRREKPDRIVYAPNYWQWFAHQQDHGLLPPELAHCRTQLDLIRHLGLDVFSRNIYSDQHHRWFGGLAEEVWDGVEFVETHRTEPNGDILIHKTYHTRAGTLTERQRYVFADSTLVQEKFLLDNFAAQMDAFLALVAGRRWRFLPERYASVQRNVGDDGVVNSGELFSPLKLLHFAAGADNAVFLLEDFPERCAEVMWVHEDAQLDLVRQMTAARVPAMMAMDNLDSMFHTPVFIERCSAGFYERASQLCHEAGASFFIHACGRQRATLPFIAALGVDGLEGVAYPPLGDVQLDEAMEMADDRFIITGGISAMETEKFQSADEVRRYVEDLFRRMRPYAHRFVLAASCNTSIRTPWKVIQWFRDAWKEFAS